MSRTCGERKADRNPGASTGKGGASWEYWTLPGKWWAKTLGKWIKG